ncbi:MAG: ABC transporter permease [Caulobacterales bacterium]
MDTHTLDQVDVVAERPRFRVRNYGAWNWLGLQTLILREVKRFMKVWQQTVIGPLMSTLLFMMVFSFAFPGRHWSDTGLPYASGLAPGLIMMSILTNAFQNTSSSMVQAKMQGTSVDFLMPPISALELTIAFIVGAVIRGIVVGVVSIAAVAAFADVLPVYPVVALYFAVVAAVIFAAVGLIGGIWAEKFDHVAAVTTFAITPLTMLSGTFYSVDALPAPFNVLLHWNPVFFMIDGFRFGFIGEAHSDLLTGVLFTGALALSLCWGAWALLKSGYGLKA